jgi:hypothetical protein
MHFRHATPLAISILGAIALTGCSAESPSTGPAGGDGALAACPANVVLQTNWFPEPEHAAAYELVDPENATIDANAGIYKGPALADENVTIEVRAGGPFIGFQSSTALLYSDDSIMLAMIDTDESVKLSADQPTKAVFTPFQNTPQALFYDPQKFDFGSFADIGKSDATVQYFEGATYMSYLVAEGFIREDQIDGSFDGSVTRLVAGEDVVMQGYITQEPWRLKNEFTEFGRDVGQLRLDEAGYEIYPSVWAGRPETVDAEDECLAQLVPALQQAQVDYMANPEPVNTAISEYLTEIDQFFQISPEFAADITEVMASDGMVVNGVDGVMGSFEPERMDRMTKKLVEVFDGVGVETADNLAADALYTNEFLDSSISLP